MKNQKAAVLDKSLAEMLAGTLSPEQLVEGLFGAGLTPGTQVIVLAEAKGAAGYRPLSSGTAVAVTEDPTYPYSGQRGRVKGSLKGGLIDVEFPNGVVTPMQATLLIPIGS